MRLIWIVGGPPAAKSQLEEMLTLERTGVEYIVELTADLNSIPQAHILNPSVIILMDAFAASVRGFSGLKALREKGCKGPLFIFGEPATEEASHAFASLGLSGFFPPFERADFSLVAGILQACLYYDGHVEVEKFIQPGGRASSEVIKSLKDFNAFSAKLSAFVSRFGIDLVRLRKILMALSLPHVKTDTGVPTIEHPFTIYYGMDPLKMVLAAPTFSRGASLDTVRGNYASALSSIQSEKPFAGAMFPEFHHITKATQNLILFSGSSSSADALSLDPMLLVTTLSFPPKDQGIQPASYFFSFVHVVPTVELTDTVGQGEVPVEGNADTVNGGAHGDALSAQETHASHEPLSSSKPFIQSADIGHLLGEPELVGDAPVIVDDGVRESASTHLSDLEPAATLVPGETLYDRDSPANESYGDTSEINKKLQAALDECERLRKISESMGADIKRLMKERREPTTDRELRDSNKKFQEQIKQLTLEKVKGLEMIATRDKQIELMKVQMEMLKKEKAA